MAQATGGDIVSAQGFWDKPEKDQVSALAAVSPKFKSSNPQVQRATLQKLHEMSGSGVSPAAKPPSAPAAPKAAAPQAPPSAPNGKPAAAPPEGALPENQPGIHFPSLSEFGRVAKDWVLGGPHSIQAAVKPAIEKGVGWAAGKIEGLNGAPKESQDFSKGLAEGMAEMGIDMTTPANLAMIGAMTFGAGEVAEGSKLAASSPKLAKILRLLPKAVKLKFQGEQAVDLLKSIDGGTKAYDKKDFEELGKAVARTISDALLIEGARRSGKAKTSEAEKAKTSEAEAPPKTPGRFDQPAEQSGVASEWNRLVEETKKKAETKAPAARPPEPVKPSGKPTPPKSAQEAEKRVLDATEADRQRRGEELLAKYDKSKSATPKAPPQGPPKLPAAGPGKPATPPPPPKPTQSAPPAAETPSQAPIAPPEVAGKVKDVYRPMSLESERTEGAAWRNARAQVRRSPEEGSSLVAMNPQARAVLADAIGSRSASGLHAKPTEAMQLAQDIEERAQEKLAEGSIDQEGVDGANEVARQIRDNAKKGITLYTSNERVPKVLRDTLQSVRHEQTHAQFAEIEDKFRSLPDGEGKLKEWARSIADTPEAKKAMEHLASRGYEVVRKNPNALIDEIASHVAAGDAERVGLSEQEAASFSRKYSDSIRENLGEDAAKQALRYAVKNSRSPAAPPPGPTVQRGTATEGKPIVADVPPTQKTSKASGAPANRPPEKVTKPETKATKGAGAPDTPQQAELSQSVRSIFEQATTANLEGVKITAVDAEGKPLFSIEYDTDQPPAAVTRELSRYKGIARIDVDPIGENKAGLKRWSKFLTGKPITSPPLNMPKSPREAVGVNF